MEFATSTSLEAWLGGKPTEWAQVIAVRTALRALPFMVKTDENWMRRYALLPLRAIFIAWAARNFPAHQLNAAYSASAFAAVRAADAAYADGTYADAADAAPRTAYAAADAAAVSTTQTSATAIRAAVRAADRAMASAAPDTHAAFAIAFWKAVSDDCDWLAKQKEVAVASQILSNQPLWAITPPNIWHENWRSLAKILCEIDTGYTAWIEWFERRIMGQDSAFDIPGDTDREGDKGILIRLVNATDEDFWGKGHEYVNATLKSWLVEARERVALPVGMAEEKNEALALSPAPPPVPPQNRNALSFQADEHGKITIDATAFADQLRIDVGAQDRHAEVIAEAKNVLNRCQRSNAGARLTQLFENYLAAAGEVIGYVKPSLLVQRGERLRQELSAYENPDSFLAPLADDLLLDMKGWQSAHNMLVGLDPVLNTMDTAILGPDRQPLLIPPNEIRQKSEAADEAGMLAENVVEVLIEAADLAPAVPDPNDRRTILSNEMMRNLVIEAFSVALNNPKKAVVGIVVTGVAVSTLPAGTTLLGVGGGAMTAAGFLVRERAWIEKQMGNTPAWRDLFLHVSKLIEDKTHFKPKSSAKGE